MQVVKKGSTVTQTHQRNLGVLDLRHLPAEERLVAGANVLRPLKGFDARLCFGTECAAADSLPGARLPIQDRHPSSRVRKGLVGAEEDELAKLRGDLGVVPLCLPPLAVRGRAFVL